MASLRLAPPMRQLLRYGMVSAVAFSLDLLLLFLLVDIGGLHYLLAACIAYLLGTLCHYWMAIRWVFDFRRLPRWQHELAVYALIGAAGLALNALAIGLLVELAGISYLAAKPVAAALIVLLNFAARKLLLFTAHHPS